MEDSETSPGHKPNVKAKQKFSPINEMNSSVEATPTIPVKKLQEIKNGAGGKIFKSQENLLECDD